MATVLSSVHMDDKVTSYISKNRKMLINGQWVEAASGKTFPTYNPATGEVLARVAEGDREDIDRAVKAARAAFETGPWSKMTPSERGRLIWKLGDLLEQNLEEFAELEMLDNGKPLKVARVADVPLAVDLFRYMAGWATKIEGNTIPISGKFFAYTLRQPVGVVGQIIPWNFPLLMAAWKLGPALATGCTVVIKPAEQTPLTCLRLGELVQEAGIPDGVVNIVPGYGETAGAALASHPDVDKVAFTGSTEVGKLILQAAAGNLKKVSLELGGKSPNVVFGDGDVKSAIAGSASAIFFNHGQCCCAGSRLYVEKSIFDEVVEGVSAKAEKINVGPGWEDSSDMGPLVSEEQLNRVCGFLESGRSEGAKAVVGGGRHGDKGYFVKPTVLVDTNENMKVVREEIFGPVVSAIPFTDYDDVPQASQRHGVRTGGGHLDERCREGASPGVANARRHGVDQLLQRIRRRVALWRVQAIGLGPRNGSRCAGALHRSKVGLHRAVVFSKQKSTEGKLRLPFFFTNHVGIAALGCPAGRSLAKVWLSAKSSRAALDRTAEGGCPHVVCGDLIQNPSSIPDENGPPFSTRRAFSWSDCARSGCRNVPREPGPHRRIRRHWRSQVQPGQMEIPHRRPGDLVACGGERNGFLREHGRQSVRGRSRVRHAEMEALHRGPGDVFARCRKRSRIFRKL